MKTGNTSGGFPARHVAGRTAQSFRAVPQTGLVTLQQRKRAAKWHAPAQAAPAGGACARGASGCGRRHVFGTSCLCIVHALPRAPAPETAPSGTPCRRRLPACERQRPGREHDLGAIPTERPCTARKHQGEHHARPFRRSQRGAPGRQARAAAGGACRQCGSLSRRCAPRPGRPTCASAGPPRQPGRARGCAPC